MLSPAPRWPALLVLWATLATPAISQAPLDSAFFAGMTARSVGPSGMSGRIAAIDGVHADPNVIYAGAATGGLWKSTSGGMTWTPLMDDYPASSIGAIAIYQAAPDIVYVGTGERNRRNSAGVGTGVYKTMDGGKSWTHLGLEQTGAIEAIIVHPNDPNTAWVGALGNTWSEGEDRGVYKTTDGGKSWRKVLYIDDKTGVGDLVVDPSNPNHLIAAMWQHRRWPWFFSSGGPGSGMHVSYDGGETWKKLGPKDGLPEGELGRMGLDFSVSNPNVVYALIEAKRSVIARSDDGGLTWRVVNRTEGIGDRPFYYGQVRVDPENENRVYNVRSPLDLSEDGAKSFRTLLPFARVHVDHHAFYINPNDGRFIVDGNDGGIYISRDRGETWQFVENLPLAQFYHINVDMETPYHILGGLQDNGSWRGPSSIWENGGIRYYHWREVDFGDGFAALAHPADRRYVFAMSQGGSLVRSDVLTGEWKSIRPSHPDGVALRFNWNAGIAIDPFDGAVYYGSQFVHRTADMGQTWTILSPDLTTDDSTKQRQFESGGLTYDVTAAENHTTILTIAPSPVEQGVIWVGTDDGNVQLTRDGGRTWTNLINRIPGVPKATWVPHIEASKFDRGAAFVVFDDHRRGNNTPYVFQTTDYGRTWTSLVTPEIEPFNFVHVIEQDPVSRNLLFLGTEYGMYLSLDGGKRWRLWRNGLPRAPHRALVVHPRDHDLVIGTHGRAAYVLDDVRPLRALATDPALAEKPLHLFEIPPTIQYNAAQVAGMRFLADAKFVGENRPYGALLTYLVAGGGDSAKVAITVTDAAGDTVRRFEGPARRGLNRTAWNLRYDGPRRPGADDTPAAFLPPGPPVLAGVFTVTVRHGSEVSSGTVRVDADPRFQVSEADQRAKRDLLLVVAARQNVLTEAIDRLNASEKAVGRVLEQVGKRTDAPSKELTEAARALQKRITETKETFLGPQGKQGIVRDDQAVSSKVGSVYSALASSRDAPTEAQRLEWTRAEAALASALQAVNRLLSEEVGPFRQRAGTSLLEVFPATDPLSLDWKRP
ncbi:MAG: WD40/YVTN/BNR-like repeat-containing protein [Gemmatimonadales bacterium]